MELSQANMMGDRELVSLFILENRNLLCSKRCRKIHYEFKDQPQVSVIIPVFNECYSVLLRTISSLIHRTAEDIIGEIILVDDFSTYEDTDAALRILDRNFSKVVLHRITVRKGLIMAKQIGAQIAKYEILMFMDSHTEVNEDWLPPLIQTIQEDPEHQVAVPVIDTIDTDTFRYIRNPTTIGGFNWGLFFTWQPIVGGTISVEKDSIIPVKTPTFSGGYFAISKKMYDSFGGYDTEMKTWGAENLEMSFRIWMCGGKIELIPCSRVGHVFRVRRMFGEMNSTQDRLHNALRMGHVWMDQYLERFFKIRPDARNVDYGDISERQRLRQDLQCSSFQTYLEKFFPNLL